MGKYKITVHKNNGETINTTASDDDTEHAFARLPFTAPDITRVTSTPIRDEENNR